MKEHKWSGWPGATCQICGVEDARECCASQDHWSNCPNCNGPTDPPCSTCYGTGCLVDCKRPECQNGECIG